MGIYAVVQHDMVENVIVLSESQTEEMGAALNAELVNALPLGLCIGDMRVGESWTRNLNGAQTVLEPLTPQQQTDYNGLRNEVIGLTATLTEAEAALTEGVESIG